MRTIVVGTRKSTLALIQTNWVIEALKKAGVNNQIETKEISTKGDRKLDVALSKVGGSGIFIKDIEQALVDKEIDFAVHSMKDLPVTMPEGFIIAAVPAREDYRDAFISKNHVKLKDLPKGAIVGTSSIRRSAQILAERPDIQTKSIRGAVDSRLEQLETGNYDAIILAVAGLKRLGLGEEIITEYLSIDSFAPAVGQGALAIECREDDYVLRALLAKINEEDVANAVSAERIFQDLLEDREQVPIGAYAYVENKEIVLHATVASADGKITLKETVRGINPTAVAKIAANNLINKGAKKIIDSVKEEINR